MDFDRISPNNQALIYLKKRLLSDDYRGLHKSQHNRFDLDRVTKILSSFYEFVGNGKMAVRHTDISKRPTNEHDENQYAVFCDKVKQLIGTGTQDAMRKNYFVDFERMGFLVRFDKNGQANSFSSKKFPARSVSLSPLGLKFVKTSSLLDKAFIYSKGVDKLLSGVSEILINILTELPNHVITLDEYMFILSAVGDKSDISLTETDALELLENYRSLSRTQRNAVINMVQSYANPDSFSGNKTKKRDYGNWKNETQQIFDLLGQTVYFEMRNISSRRTLTLAGDNSVSPEVGRRLRRSLAEKHNYFSNHSVEHREGFELHHVVSLSTSENIQHFKLLDSWKNMVYISAYEHSLITQNGSRNVLMSFRGDDLQLADYSGGSVKFKFGKTILYSPSKQPVMVNYNNQLNSYK